MHGAAKVDGSHPLNFTNVAVLLGLAALTSLVMHQLGYLLAIPAMGDTAVGGTAVGNTAVGNTAVGDHGHLSAQWAIVTPVAVISAVVMILRQVRNLGVAPAFQSSRLAAVAGVLFVAQETTEALVAGQSIGSVASHPAVWIGLLLAPLVALAVVRLLRRVGDIVAESGRTRPFVPGRFVADLSVSHRVLMPASVFVCVAAPRGPPALLVRA